MRSDVAPLAGLAWSLAADGCLTPSRLATLARNTGRGLALDERAGPLPSALVIEPTDACTLDCPGCGYNLSVPKTRTRLAFSDYTRIIDEAAPAAIAVLLYLAGEPFLHPELPAMVEHAARRRLAVVISTNGNFPAPADWAQRLAQAHCHTLIFSLSGHAQEVYAAYHRRGSLAAVQERIREALAARRSGRHPRVVIRYLDTGTNAGDIAAARAYYTNLGVDRFEVRQALAQLSVSGTNAAPAPSGNSQPARHNACFWLWSIPVIKADLRVIPCCYEFFGVPPLGSLRDRSLAEIWNGPAYRAFRARVLRERPTIPCCAQCRSRLGFQDEAFAEKRTVTL